MTTMDRRSAIKAMAGALAAFILPAPRRHIDLSAFCARRLDNRYDMRLPYTVGDWTFATNAAVCVRVRPDSGDRVQREGKIPPFDSLSWNHDRLAPSMWKSLPKLDPIMAADSDCPACDGTGYAPGVYGEECASCFGVGTLLNGEWGTGWRTCPDCKGKGSTSPHPECAHCRGHAIGNYPALVCLDGRYFEAKLYEKVARLGGDYTHDNWRSMPGRSMLKFRFDGGSGLLMGCETERSKERIRAAYDGPPEGR